MAVLVTHFLIFALIIIGFLIVPLLVGRFVRPSLPTAEKDSIYECGEPTIGTSYIQFDLRFYVVALLFIIFDVEIAFFFPWAKIYGQATQLADSRLEDSHSGTVLVSKETATLNKFPVRFDSAVHGVCEAPPEKSEVNNRLNVTLKDELLPNAGPYQIRFTSGELSGQLLRISRYRAKENRLSLRKELSLLPQKGAKFVIDSFNNKSFEEKSLKLQWTTGANQQHLSDIISYHPENELLVLEKPLAHAPKPEDRFVIVDPSRMILTEKILSQPADSLAGEDAISSATGLKLAMLGFVDILVFFAVLLVGFAYVWKRGDLDWVRAVADKARQNSPVPPALANKK